jgi:D-amino peptidase
MSDLEGATGVTGFDYRKTIFGRFKSHKLINRYRANLTMDILAAISGAVDAGANEISVCDGHGNNSIIKESLPSKVNLVSKGSCWMPELDNSFSALLMIGFHAKYGVKKALLNHSFSRNIKAVLFNGKEIGEIELCAIIAGAYGVPSVFISGDDYAVIEAQNAIPGIKSAVVKYSISRSKGDCLPPKKTYDLIRNGVHMAIDQKNKILPLVKNPPFKLTRLYHWPGISILRRISKGHHPNDKTKLFQQEFFSNNLISLSNRVFGYSNRD